MPQHGWSRAEKFPDNLALVDAVNGDSFTFSGARSLARSFESGLVRMGGHAADVVAIVLPNMPQYALAFLGAAEAGFVITTLNPTYTSGEIKGQLMNGERCYRRDKHSTHTDWGPPRSQLYFI